MKKQSYKTSMQNAAATVPDAFTLSDGQLEQLKETLLDMMLELIRVCRKNGLRIMLAGGSALGAVRHQGFIPWDDDIDLMMPRDDYEKFCGLFEKEMGKTYDLVAPNCGKARRDRFPKIMKRGTVMRSVGGIGSKTADGVFLDIFILENVPKNRVVRMVKGLFCTALMFIGSKVQMYEADNPALQSLMEQTTEGRKLHRSTRFWGRLFSLVPAGKWYDWIDRSVRYRKETGLLGLPTGRKHYFGEILPERVFLPPSEGVFEGHAVPLPADCDAYLKNLYGDYMQIPPPEKREKHLIVELKL